MENILIIGAGGSIGNYIYNKFTEKQYNTFGTSSKKTENLIYLDCLKNETLNNLKSLNNINVVVWCQGFNINNNIKNINLQEHNDIMNCNCNFIILVLNYLLKNNILENNAKLCIISSIWQNMVRNNKFSYSVSKSALAGLVKSISIDLSENNILINNILPGPIDNEMTRKTLSKEQLQKVFNHTGFNRLTSLEDIFNLVYFLCIINNSITGQSINIDLGMSIFKNI